MGFARLAEDSIKKIRGKGENEKLGAFDKIIASSIGGALATWNQPIEVIRVEVPTLQNLPLTDAHKHPRCKAWPRARLTRTVRQS